MNLNISLGNSKLGKIPNISLPAIITCPEGVPCKEECYCNSNIFYWKKARGKWKENLELYEADPNDYFTQLDRFLAKKKPPYFRYHVSGDCPDQNYVDYMAEIADLHKHTKFLVFTKRFEFDFYESDNFRVKYSTWSEWWTDKNPKAYVITKEEIKTYGYDQDYHICQGNCDGCYYCWTFNKDVILPKH